MEIDILRLVVISDNPVEVGWCMGTPIVESAAGRCGFKRQTYKLVM